MERKNVAPEVATPRSAWLTAFCTAMTSTCIEAPMPTPSTNMDSETASVPVLASSRDSRNSPSVMTAVPAIGKILYRPHLLTSWPVVIEVSSSPAIMGSSRSPDAVGVAPFTICMYCGR
jgi:hypothetical protein